MQDEVNDRLSPEEQIDDVRACLDRLRLLPEGTLRDLELRDAERYLEEILKLDASGDLPSLPGLLWILADQSPSS